MLLNTEFTKGKIIVPTFVDCAKIILLLINRLLLISFKIEEEKKEGEQRSRVLSLLIVRI